MSRDIVSVFFFLFETVHLLLAFFIAMNLHTARHCNLTHNQIPIHLQFNTFIFYAIVPQEICCSELGALTLTLFWLGCKFCLTLCVDNWCCAIFDCCCCRQANLKATISVQHFFPTDNGQWVKSNIMCSLSINNGNNYNISSVSFWHKLYNFRFTHNIPILIF